VALEACELGDSFGLGNGQGLAKLLGRCLQGSRFRTSGLGLVDVGGDLGGERVLLRPARPVGFLHYTSA
jgi:hypothetical protein